MPRAHSHGTEHGEELQIRLGLIDVKVCALPLLPVTSSVLTGKMLSVDFLIGFGRSTLVFRCEKP